MSYFGKRKIVSVGLIHCNGGRTKNLGSDEGKSNRA